MDSDTNANANAVVNTDVTDEQQNPDPIWMQKIQGIFGEFRALLTLGEILNVFLRKNRNERHEPCLCWA